MKRLFLLLSVANMLFASYVLVVKNDRSAEILKAFGVGCEKKNSVYYCIKSDNKVQLLRLKYYIKNNLDIDSFVVNENEAAKIAQTKKIKEEKTTPKPSKNTQKKSMPVKSGYCIQVVTSDKVGYLLKDFKNVKNMPYARIEKIGKYYVIRVAQSDKVKKIKPLLNEIKRKYKHAFVRKCDYIPSRIVKKGD